ncbi:efflux RND transporter periplasmic adaptor subunit [Reichenbachiella sp. MALMAid0571]|uniref:efflux RND transporter periplasmic adaptor subunit n=1 Tax=Reichenbachiella sp. MALMAid0571 TaxID=3143939 RepID=UPI0032DEDC97
MMKIFNRIKIRQSGLFLLTVFIGLASCGVKNNPEALAEADGGESSYIISPSQFSSFQMQIGKMELRDFYRPVIANGMFDVPPENKASVSTYFGGYVKQLSLLPGEEIKKGQVMFVIENPEFVQFQQDYLEAQGLLSYLKSDYERQKNLAQNNVTSQKNFLKAEADYKTTLARYESLKRKLGLMGINTANLSATNMQTQVSVKAPISGYVTAVNVNRGMYVNPSDIAITIINTDHLHLELSLFEKDFADVAVGQPISFKIQSDPNKEYQASVHLINKSIDSQNRTASIHGHLSQHENDSKLFIPGMYVEAEIHTSVGSSLSLPEAAVVEIGGKHFVLTKTGNSEKNMVFEKKQVQVGKLVKGHIEILNHEDFSSNTEFLTSGAFFIMTG